MFDPEAHNARLNTALELFVERLQEDRHVLAAVLIGTLSRDLAWFRDGLHLWVIEADGVTRRHKADGDDPRIFRTLVEDDLNIGVELIERSTFKRMVEGSTRTAFSHSFFAARRLVWSRDASIAQWFDQANTLALRDQQQALFTTTTWLISAHRHATHLLDRKGAVERAALALCSAAGAVAAGEVVRAGEIVEDGALSWAKARDPDLFHTIHTAPLRDMSSPTTVRAGLSAVDALLSREGIDRLGPLVAYLRSRPGAVPLTEICDHFAYGQLEPWHLDQACEWLVRHDHATKLSVPYKLTRRSRTDVEEPAYAWSDGP